MKRPLRAVRWVRESQAFVRHAGSVGRPRKQEWPLGRQLSSAGSVYEEEGNLKYSHLAARFLTCAFLSHSIFLWRKLREAQHHRGFPRAVAPVKISNQQATRLTLPCSWEDWLLPDRTSVRNITGMLFFKKKKNFKICKHILTESETDLFLTRIKYRIRQHATYARWDCLWLFFSCMS